MTTLAVSVIEHTAFSLLQPVASPLINAITGKGVRRAEKGQEGGIILLLPLPLVMKLHLRRGAITWNIWVKMFSLAPPFNQCRDY